MADHCGVCRSVDVVAGTRFRTCLSCGASTSYDGGKVVSGADVAIDAPAPAPAKKASKAAKG